jgi:hypothetical protein
VAYATDGGVVNFNRVFTTQSQLVTQQDQLAISRGSIALSLISIYRALGGGWQSFENSADAEACGGSEGENERARPGEAPRLLRTDGSRETTETNSGER